MELILFDSVQPGCKPVHMLSNKMHVHRFGQVTKMLCVSKLPDTIMMNLILLENATLCISKEKPLVRVSVFVAEEWRKIRAAVVLHRDRVWRTCCGFCAPFSAAKPWSSLSFLPTRVVLSNCCAAAAEATLWRVQFPLCLPSSWPIVGYVLGKNGFSLGEGKLQTS